MITDPARINVSTDPLSRRMTGVTAHGLIPFDVPFITEITPGLWQGGCENGLVLPGNIRHLVSLYQMESWTVRHELASSLSVRMLDAVDQDTSAVDAVARWVLACKASGPVLVSCQAGLNRSGLIVARALMLGGATAGDAIAMIRQKRSKACLCNPAFERHLRSLSRGRGHGRGLEAANAARVIEAGRRDAARLRAALDRAGDSCPGHYRLVAEARIAAPDMPWSSVAAGLGFTKDQAVGYARRLVRLAEERGGHE